MSEKTTIFVGKMKNIETKFGVLTKISFGPTDFEKFENAKKNGWVNLVIKTSKAGEPYIAIDDFVPIKQQSNLSPEEARDMIGDDGGTSIEDVPF